MIEKENKTVCEYFCEPSFDGDCSDTGVIKAKLWQTDHET